MLGQTSLRCEVFWDGLGDCYEQGLVKAVGVSNYGNLSHLSHALSQDHHDRHDHLSDPRNYVAAYSGIQSCACNELWSTCISYLFINMKAFIPYLP